MIICAVCGKKIRPFKRKIRTYCWRVEDGKIVNYCNECAACKMDEHSYYGFRLGMLSGYERI